jgi:hypothetical protein
MGGDQDLSKFWLNPAYTTSRLPALGTTSFMASRHTLLGSASLV